MDILFYLGIALIIVHEMDAVCCHEWRIFPGLSSLKDNVACRIFILAHIPLFSLFFWYIYYSPDLYYFILGFNIFLVVHWLLHILFLKHKNNEFKDWVSWSIISAAGLCGVLSLIIILARI
ncbi:MAG: DUF6713 family protein [Dysgonomonas sp.]|nr:DUF6713 family protein [Dysgonomonas sp.]